jgi:hypothetical protein
MESFMRRFTLLIAVTAVAASLAGFSQASFAGGFGHPGGFGFGRPHTGPIFHPNPLGQNPFTLGRP